MRCIGPQTGGGRTDLKFPARWAVFRPPVRLANQGESREIAWSGHLLTEAETRLEDAIGIEMKIEQPMGIETNRINLNLTLRTVPRDYR